VREDLCCIIREAEIQKGDPPWEKRWHRGEGKDPLLYDKSGGGGKVKGTSSPDTPFHAKTKEKQNGMIYFWEGFLCLYNLFLGMNWRRGDGYCLRFRNREREESRVFMKGGRRHGKRENVEATVSSTSQGCDGD